MNGDIKREWFDTDYYAVLGVAKDAPQAEITKAYRQLARENHPDANPGDAKAEERFKEISAAYDVVGDEEKRALYDQTRRMGPMGGGFGGGGPGAGPGGFSFDGSGDLGDILGSMFGGGLFGDQPGGRHRRMQSQGRDQEAQLTIDFDEALRGTTASLSLSDGSGQRTIRVRIPAGVHDGKRIRIRGKGGAGTPPGDLYVVITVSDHPVFGRDGDRLTLELPVTIDEAALGAEVRVPSYSSDHITVRVPPGTQTGRVMRVRGGGVPNAAGVAGDLIVTITVAVPENLSKEQQKALEAFREASTESPRRHLDAYEPAS